MVASKKKPIHTRWFNGDTPLEDLDPSAQIAHEIVLQHRDLAPSVDRIMTAELTDPQRLHALDLFQKSLVDVDAPYRDPRAAIAAAAG